MAATLLSFLLASTCMLAFACGAAPAAGPKRVMLLHSFGRDFTPWSRYAGATRAELSRRAPWPLDTIDHARVTARFGGEIRDGALIAYLQATYAGDPLDVIVTMGAPASQFVQRQRLKLFPTTAVVFAAIDKNQVNYAEVVASDVVVVLRSDLDSFFESMLRISPETNNAVRFLADEKAADIQLPAIEFVRPKFDGRELQRWGIPESRLPPESEIYVHSSSAWEQFRLQIIGICAALLVQIGLISWLVHERQRRHLAEIQSRIAITELTYMDRIATAGELSASIAHEINQPLTGITTRASAALRWLAPETFDVEKARAALTQIVAAGERAGDIVSGVRAMFKNEPAEPALLDINRLIRTVLEIVRVELQNNDVTVDLRLDHVQRIRGDRVQLQQVILNLVMNAIESMKSAQPRMLRVHSAPNGAHAVRVSIEDTGTGVDPANIDRIFKALFTTKARGMGMGLSICRSIVENHGGRIWVSPAARIGSIFQFELPTASAQT